MHATPKEDKVLHFITNYIELRGYAPSLREISEGVGNYSHSSVHKHLHSLAHKRYLRITPRIPRSIRVTPKGLFRVSQLAS